MEATARIAAAEQITHSIRQMASMCTAI